MRQQRWDGHKKRLKRLSVYWWTRFSSQQEFFPCSIIAARLPTQTCTEGAWITSWCHFLNFHSWSRRGAARFQTWAARRRALDGPCTVNITYVNGPKRWSEEQRGSSSSTSSDRTQPHSFGPFLEAEKTVLTRQKIPRLSRSLQLQLAWVNMFKNKPLGSKHW